MKEGLGHGSALRFPFNKCSFCIRLLSKTHCLLCTYRVLVCLKLFTSQLGSIASLPASVTSCVFLHTCVCEGLCVLRSFRHHLYWAPACVPRGGWSGLTRAKQDVGSLVSRKSPSDLRAAFPPWEPELKPQRSQRVCHGARLRARGFRPFSPVFPRSAV